MRVGIVYHKNPLAPPTRIDLIRLRAISSALRNHGWTVEVIAPVKKGGMIDDRIPVHPLGFLDKPGRYDVIKTCYHHSIGLIGDYKGPLACRIVRVVDEHLPARDETSRAELLQYQEMIRQRADALILNNQANADRWRSLYGPTPPITMIPNGCPSKLPPLGVFNQARLPDCFRKYTGGTNIISMSLGLNPYPSDKPAVLFLGSLAAPRMVHLLNELAARVRSTARIHHIGRNVVHLYGGDKNDVLSPLVVRHGEIPEPEVWDYVRHADVGLALAAGPDAFDNDLSKVVTYLRGGLPVLSEEKILNNHVILETGHGRVFAYDDVGDMVKNLFCLLSERPAHKKEDVEKFMIDHYSWEKMGNLHHHLLKSLT